MAELNPCLSLSFPSFRVVYLLPAPPGTWLLIWPSASLLILSSYLSPMLARTVRLSISGGGDVSEVDMAM